MFCVRLLMLVYSQTESEGMSGFQTLNVYQCSTRVKMSYVDMMFRWL